jgi:serine/threonine-protein kinase
MLIAHVVDKPIPLASIASKVPSPIADVVMRGLATDPSERWTTAEEFGVALADAATASWNTDWLARSDIPFMGNDVPTSSGSAALHFPTTTGSRGPSTPESTVVKPVQPLSRTGGNVVGSDFRSPRVPYVVAAVLAIAAGIVAFIGLGAPARGGDLKPGMVTIAGVDPVTAAEVPIDMTQPIPVTVAGIPGDTAGMSLNILGFSLGNHDAPLAARGPGLEAAIPDPLNPYIVAGRLSGELRIGNGDGGTVSYHFGIRSTQPATTTALAVGVVFLALFALAYTESYTRTLRSGRSEVSAWVGLPVATATLAVAVVGGAWVLAGREPTVTTLVTCAAIGAAAGFSAGRGAIRRGQLNRYRRSHRSGPHAAFTGNTTRIIGGSSNPNTTGSRRISGWLKIGAGSQND